MDQGDIRSPHIDADKAEDERASCLQTFRDLEQTLAELADKQASLLTAGRKDRFNKLDWHCERRTRLGRLTLDLWDNCEPVKTLMEELRKQYSKSSVFGS